MVCQLATEAYWIAASTAFDREPGSPFGLDACELSCEE